MKLFIILYVLPLVVSVLYFTSMKLKDMLSNDVDKYFPKDGISYLKCSLLCLIPALNMISACMAICIIAATIAIELYSVVEKVFTGIRH